MVYGSSSLEQAAFRPEYRPGNERVGIATTTQHRGWQPIEAVPLEERATNTDLVRGDLSLATITEALNQGYNVVVVDGGSSDAFLEALASTGAIVQAESKTDPGMSGSRRQAFKAVSKLAVKVICWTETEKLSMVRDCLAEPVRMILDDEADLVIPSRDDEAFATYPDYQVGFEKESNFFWNKILRRHGLMDVDAPDLDAWIGPRIFKNQSELVDLFLNKYAFARDRGRTEGKKLAKDSPDLWSNAIFLPVMAAMAKNYRVAGVNVPYRHPEAQTRNETDSPKFLEKREKQQRSILTTTVHFARLLESGHSRYLQAVA
jgi:glycosyltransferase involved in cell wall biosynthesis